MKAAQNRDINEEAMVFQMVKKKNVFLYAIFKAPGLYGRKFAGKND